MRGAICRPRRALGSAPRASRPARRKHGCWRRPDRSWRRRGQADHEARARLGGLALGGDRAGAVFRPDAAAMGLDDLLRDREPEPGILSKTLMRPVGVKTLEDALQ